MKEKAVILLSLYLAFGILAGAAISCQTIYSNRYIQYGLLWFIPITLADQLNRWILIGLLLFGLLAVVPGLFAALKYRRSAEKKGKEKAEKKTKKCW